MSSKIHPPGFGLRSCPCCLSPFLYGPTQKAVNDQASSFCSNTCMFCGYFWFTKIKDSSTPVFYVLNMILGIVNIACFSYYVLIFTGG